MTRSGARLLLASTTLVAALSAMAAPMRGAPARVDARHTIVKHYTQRDQQVDRYVYVPVEVPSGTTAITFTYAYDAADGANVVDFGLYEPGPLTLGTPALRGWTGGARRRITVGVADATPGYWPGDIPAGEWHVMLGLYKVARAGVTVTLTIEFSQEPAEPTPALPVRQRAPIKTGAAWYSGIGHSHTVSSDGTLTATALIEQARRERLDFLAITDHNNTTHQRDPLDRPDLLVITGEEVTTPGGHFNVWGLRGVRDYVDFRVAPGDPALAGLLEAVHQRGGAVSINHPISECLACSWAFPIPQGIDAVEIANGNSSARQRSMTIWDTLLRAGRRITAVEGRDWHRGTEPLGAPVLRVWAPALSEAAVLEAIRRGRAVVMANAALPAPEFTVEANGQVARVGDTLAIERGHQMQMNVSASASDYRGARIDWLWNGEVVESGALDEAGRARLDRYASATGYARVHLVAADESLLAVTNPVFVAVR
jgi:hypothetical protein